MITLIALFRGINVGGKNIIKMKELVHLLEGLGLTQVRYTWDFWLIHLSIPTWKGLKISSVRANSII